MFAAVVTSPRWQAQLYQGLNDLDLMRTVPFSELEDDPALTVLRGVQDAPFFVDILNVAGIALYNDAEVWDLLGYPGPSFHKGGYLERGFNDLDWLPEPSVQEVAK